MGLAAASALATALMLLAASPAEAHSGLYFGFGVGIGDFSGNELVTEEEPGDGDVPVTEAGVCCPDPGLAAGLRVGFSIFGFGGPEFSLLAHGWNLGEDAGGAGFVGGGIRVFPLRFLSLVGLTSDDFPLVFGTGVMFGYGITGKDFAYQGTSWTVDFSLEYRLLSVLSAGLKLDLVFPNYDDFRFTSLRNDRGRCLDGNAVEISEVVDAGQAQCSGRGPNTTLISPQVVFTFHFDLLGPL